MTFVDLYHPALGNVHVLADSSAVSLYEAHGWVLSGGGGPAPDPIDLTPALGDLRYVQLADRTTFVPFWKAAEAVTTGTVRVDATGHLITANSNRTTRGSYDATEQAAWTVVSGGGSSLPTQTSNGGKFLTTDGTSASWATVPAAYTDEMAQDAIAALFGAGTDVGITFVYDDAGNRIGATVAADATKTPLLAPTATKTAAYTAAVNDLAMMNVASGATTLTLPTAPADKSQVAYRAIGATTTTPLTINRGGSTDTIGTAGATSSVVALADEMVVLQYDAPNTRWLAVANVKTQASLDTTYGRKRRSVAHGAFPSSARAVAASAATQVQQVHSIVLTDDCADLAFTYENADRASAGATSLLGVQDVTIRMSIWDGSQTYPIYWPNGTRDMLLKPGATATTTPLPFSGIKGTRIWLVRLMTWAVAPTNFPAASILAGGTYDVSETGTALTDRTTSYAQFFTKTVGNFAVLPPIAITGTGKPKPVVAVLGDSIASDGTNESFTEDPDYGWAPGGLGDCEFPHVNFGNTGWQLQNITASKPMRAQLYQAMIAAGVTHALVSLGTNDLASGRTAAQMIADLATIKADLDAYGIKTIPTTLQPRTDPSNTGAAPSGEVNTLAQRASFNASIIANNGVGYGYFDLAFTQDAGNANKWNTALRTASGLSIVTGGTGYNQGDTFFFPGGGEIRVGVTAGAVAALNGTFFSNGGWVTDPPATFGPIRIIGGDKTTRGIPGFGSGATFSYTGVAAASSLTSDGIHPSVPMTRYIRWTFAAAAPNLFRV